MKPYYITLCLNILTGVLGSHSLQNHKKTIQLRSPVIQRAVMLQNHLNINFRRNDPMMYLVIRMDRGFALHI